MKRYDPTPEQRAAMDRAKSPKVHPYRRAYPCTQGCKPARGETERVIPQHARVVRL